MLYHLWMAIKNFTAISFICFALTNDFVNDVRDRCGGVDYNPFFGMSSFV